MFTSAGGCIVYLIHDVLEKADSFSVLHGSLFNWFRWFRYKEKGSFLGVRTFIMLGVMFVFVSECGVGVWAFSGHFACQRTHWPSGMRANISVWSFTVYSCSGFISCSFSKQALCLVGKMISGWPSCLHTTVVFSGFIVKIDCFSQHPLVDWLVNNPMQPLVKKEFLPKKPNQQLKIIWNFVWMVFRSTWFCCERSMQSCYTWKVCGQDHVCVLTVDMRVVYYKSMWLWGHMGMCVWTFVPDTVTVYCCSCTLQ